MPKNPSMEFVPYLSIADATRAIDYYSQVFGTRPHMCLKMPDGRVMHCEFRVGSGRFFVSEELPEHGGTPSPKRLGSTTVAIHVYVDDCDAVVQAMARQGGEILMEPVDMFWGERFGRIRDPFGHEWGIATLIREMSVDEIEVAAQQALAEMKADPSAEG